MPSSSKRFPATGVSVSLCPDSEDTTTGILNIAVKMKNYGELYTLSGPYDTFESADADLDMRVEVWGDSLGEDEYISIVQHKDE